MCGRPLWQGRSAFCADRLLSCVRPVHAVRSRPIPYYADTPVCPSANGADFTGGAVRVGGHSLRIGVPAA